MSDSPRRWWHRSPSLNSPARGTLFRKYVAVFTSLVAFAVLATGAIGVYFTYSQTEAAMLALQREKAGAAATRMEAYLHDIERQLSWMKLPTVGGDSLALRRVEYLKLLRQVPAITDVAAVGSDGREKLRLSRLDMDTLGGNKDFSATPLFAEVRKGTYFSPVHFRNDTEPYMTIAMSDLARTNITVADVNLKFIWDVVSTIRVGTSGFAYVVDSRGRLIAHPDISMVLRNLDLSNLPQVQQAIRAPAEPSQASVGRGLGGGAALSARALISPVGWHLLVEQPADEAFAPIYRSLVWTAALLAAGLVLAALLSVVLARRMTAPIATIHQGAARLGKGHLGERINVSTGDELEALASQFNQMASELSGLYEGLEGKVRDRTRELSESLEQQSRLRAGLRQTLDRLEQEMNAARTLQLGMLPTRFPRITRAQPVDVHASMQPAREVGGDLYDFFYDPQGRFWFLVGDVSGKGAQAAMFMARARSLVRLATELWHTLGSATLSPATVAATVNRELCQDNRERMFVTFFLGVLDTSTGAVSFVNAGHPRPYLLHGDVAAPVCTPPCAPLGVSARTRYESSGVQLVAGDAVFISTDGVTEAVDGQHELFGDTRLIALLADAHGEAASALVARAQQEIDAFRGQAELADDLTMLAFRWLPHSTDGQESA